MKKINKFNVDDIVISNTTGIRYRIVDVPNKKCSGYYCTNKEDSLFLFFEDEIKLVSDKELRQEISKFEQLERTYRQTQNHREELGRIFVKLIEEKGFSIEEWLGLQIELAILQADSQNYQHYMDNCLKKACGHNFEELMEFIRDN